MNDIIMNSWLELFVMAQSDKDMFKFGQFTMNTEAFKVGSGPPTYRMQNFVDVNTVKFGLLAKMDCQQDFDKFAKTFEVEMNDFVSLSEYERIEKFSFTGEALASMIWALFCNNKGGPMWVNKEWSDHIDIPQM